MPQHKSPKKRMRSDPKKRLRNRIVKSQVKTAVTHLEEAETPSAASPLLSKAFSELDRAAKRKIIKKGTASRKKSRLAKQARKLPAGS
jgi:small subunit ribosomal protein S20